MAKIDYDNKSQTAGYDASKWNAQDANEVKESVNALYDAMPPSPAYKVYSALVTNSSGIFTQKVLENTTGHTFDYTNPSNGAVFINGEENGIFIQDKTFIFIGGIDSNIIYKDFSFLPDFIGVYIRNINGSQTSTPNFSDLPIEIRIYN